MTSPSSSSASTSANHPIDRPRPGRVRAHPDPNTGYAASTVSRSAPPTTNSLTIGTDSQRAARRPCQLAVDATGLGRPVVDYLVDELQPSRSSRSRSPAATNVSGTGPGPTSRNATGRHDQPHPGTAPPPHRRRHARHRRPHRRTPHLPPDISEHGTETYSAPSGRHDDLVLALSLALWLAENRPLPDPDMWTSTFTRGDIPGIVRMGEGTLD